MSRIQSTVSGVVIEILVADGDLVMIDQDVVRIESMKMEIPVAAESAGTVVQIHVVAGQQISEGDLLVTLR